MKTVNLKLLIKHNQSDFWKNVNLMGEVLNTGVITSGNDMKLAKMTLLFPL